MNQQHKKKTFQEQLADVNWVHITITTVATTIIMMATIVILHKTKVLGPIST